MAFDPNDVLRYLSNQGFGISPFPLSQSYSLLQWNELQREQLGRFNKHSNLLGIETRDIEEVIVRPVWKDLAANYIWRPNFRQLFSRLEVTAEDSGSLDIYSQKPIFFGRNRADGYHQIRLLRTKYD